MSGAGGRPPASPASTSRPEPPTATRSVGGTAPLSIPQSLTAEQFAEAAATLRKGVAHIGDDVIVHGSRAAGTARPDSDIDFAVRVPRSQFDGLISERFGTPNPGSAKERTMQRAVETGKIQAGEAGLSRVRRSLEAQLDMDVDLSVVQCNGPFDNPPSIGVPRS